MSVDHCLLVPETMGLLLSPAHSNSENKSLQSAFYTNWYYFSDAVIVLCGSTFSVWNDKSLKYDHSLKASEKILSIPVLVLFNVLHKVVLIILSLYMCMGTWSVTIQRNTIEQYFVDFLKSPLLFKLGFWGFRASGKNTELDFWASLSILLWYCLLCCTRWF